MPPKTVEIAKDISTKEVGRSGLIQWNGRVDEEFLPQLAGERARKVYREMEDNDPVIGAMLFAVDMSVRQVGWHVEPRDDEQDAFDYAVFIEECVHDMSHSWEDTVSNILSFLPYGWSYFEETYKRRAGANGESPSKHTDGRIGWRKFALRAQSSLDRWEFDNEGGIAGMWQMLPTQAQPIFIPMEKALLFRTTSKKNNPEGRSALRNAYRPWFFKKRIEEIEGIGIERDLAGLPIAWVPPALLADDASSTEKAALLAIQQIVANVKRDENEGIVFPLAYDENGNKRYDITLLTSGGKRDLDIDATIARYDQRIAMTLLADFIMLGHEKVGSLALGTAKIDLFSAAIGAWLDEIASVFNTHAIPRLMKLNGLPPERAPYLVHADVKNIDLKDLADFLQKASTAGVITADETLEEFVRTLADLPQREGAQEL